MSVYTLALLTIVGSFLALLVFIWIAFYRRFRSEAWRFLICLFYLIIYFVVVVGLYPILAYQPSGVAYYSWNITVAYVTSSTTVINYTTTTVTIISTYTTTTHVPATVVTTIYQAARYGQGALAVALSIALLMAILFMIIGIRYFTIVASGRAR